jgi:hypothetical protein
MAKEEPESVRVNDPEILHVLDPQTQTNVWFLGVVIGVKQLQMSTLPNGEIMRYRCFTDKSPEPLVVDLPRSVPLDEKINALRLAVRMHLHGNYHQRETSNRPQTKEP